MAASSPASPPAGSSIRRPRNPASGREPGRAGCIRADPSPVPGRSSPDPSGSSSRRGPARSRWRCNSTPRRAFAEFPGGGRGEFVVVGRVDLEFHLFAETVVELVQCRYRRGGIVGQRGGRGDIGAGQRIGEIPGDGLRLVGTGTAAEENQRGCGEQGEELPLGTHPADCIGSAVTRRSGRKARFRRIRQRSSHPPSDSFAASASSRSISKISDRTFGSSASSSSRVSPEPSGYSVVMVVPSMT